jgi:hypothetical protein
VKPTPQPPRSVPVLTEVVVLPKAAPAVVEDEFPPLSPAADPAFAATAPAPLGPWEAVPPPPAPVASPRVAAVPPPSAVRAAATAASPAPAAPLGVTPKVPAASPQQQQVIDEARVVQRVMADLDKQLDLMFEHRLREALTPVLARMTDGLVRELRNQLAANLREMVAKAVSLELDRHQKR